MSDDIKIGFIDYNWETGKTESLLVIGGYAYAIEDIQDQPISITSSTIEVYHWGEWDKIEYTDSNIIWLKQQLTQRYIKYEDIRA